MKRKKYLFPSPLSEGLGMCLLLLCLCLSFASCSDDDDKPTEEQRIEKDLADAAEFWNVVGQLTDDVMPDEGWLQATYAPSIGEAEATTPTVRIVQCTDAESAAESFADLVGLTYGKDITADTPEYTYRNDLVGTLAYRRTGGETLATVDVDIRQMPGLQQIIYRQVVENASFSGTAYYRFGDVVAKKNADGQTDYWICVRPAFGLAGKGDSHWISLSKLPSANVKTVNKTVNGVKLTHLMPKSLSTNQEHMQNLAELLYAMLFPDKWAENLKEDDGYKTLKYFKDFDFVKLFRYHNDAYFSNLAEGWTSNRFKTIFGMTPDELRQELQTNGLNLIYGSATMSGNNISLPVASFYGTNLKTKLITKKTSEWKTQDFNIYNLTANGYATFTNIAGRAEHAWVIRYATGATLAKGSGENPVFDKYKRLPNCSDVFVYNSNIAHLDMNNLKNINPQVPIGPYTGSSHYKTGEVYKDENGHRWIVIYMSGKASDNRHVNCIDKEPSPYTELVSFDGLAASADHSYVTNLPTLNKTIRMTYKLATFFSNTAASVRDGSMDITLNGRFIKSLIDNTGVDLRKLFQTVLAVSGDHRNASIHASIAYRDPAISNAQPLIRFLKPIDLDNANPPYYIRTVYPLVPDKESQTYPPNNFSTTPILLQDLADADKVARYAPDLYAWRPLTPTTGGDNVTNRECRTTADLRARDVTNYYYDQALWNTYQYPLDMWNSPVLMFRVTAVYDRGDDDYETKTTDGHTLRLFSECPYELNAQDEDDRLASMATPYSFIAGNDAEFAQLTNHLNGSVFSVPTWREVWGQ